MAAISRRALLAGLTGTSAVAALGAGGWATFREKLPRRVLGVYPVVPHKDGAGVRLRKALGHRDLPMLDPFLMLDEFKSADPADYIKGFPEHPHRGFETVTIMLDGALEHQDSVGNRGLLRPGSLQWMTAGKGIVHSEMPQQTDGMMWGFQLWVNLPAAHKWDKPRYQDLQAGDIPEVDLGDARARLMAGQVGRVKGPVDGVVAQPQLLDVRVPAGGRLYHPVPGGHTVFAYVAEGEARFGKAGTPVQAGHLAVFGSGEAVSAEGESRFLLCAGAPIGEPVAKGGPFVMNTPEEIDQAWADYRSGRLVGG